MNHEIFQNQSQGVLRYGTKTLKDYQVKGKEFLKANPKAGLWDDMGLGKTLQSLAAAKDLGLGVSVVGPPKLCLDWQLEAELIGVPLTYYSYAKIPAPGTIRPGSILIIEEAHWLQGGSATARGRKGLNLCLSGGQGFTWLLTGTPMRNGKPKNLAPLLEILDVIPDQISTRDFLDQFCCPRTITVGRRLVTVYDGAARLDRLAKLIAPFSLRRKKEEVLDLLPKIYCDRQAPLSSPGLVRKSLAEFKAKLENKLKEADRLHEKDNLENLLIVNQIKRLSENQKIEYCKDLALDLEGQTLWFCCYLETASQLTKILDAPSITGETEAKDRFETIRKFQSGELKHLVLTIRAAGLGITLTAATNEVFVGREWAPEDNMQAEDRAYRIGQDKTLTVIRINNNLDRHLLSLQACKDKSSLEFFTVLKGVSAN
jgi:SNF2 family DNA or RNA helicase